MIQYLTTFSTVADYNTFLASEDCPYINVSHITGTNENKYYNNTDGPNQYLTLTVTASNNTVGCVCSAFTASSSQGGTVYYKLNNGDWTLCYNSSDWASINLPSLTYGDVLQLKCNNIKNLAYWQFEGNDGSLRIKVSGHFNSIFTSDNFKYFIIPDSYVDDNIFLRGLINYPDGQTPVVDDAEDLYLPTNLLPRRVFHHLFQNNTILTKAPDINASYLPSEACMGMFKDCTALINMPNIYATAINCRETFHEMFSGCTSLANVTPFHIATIYCSDDGNGFGAFEGMFYGCTNLTVAPSWTIEYEPKPYSGKYVNGTSTHFGQQMFNCTFENCSNLVSCNWKLRAYKSGINAPDWAPTQYETLLKGQNATFRGCSSLTTPFEISVGDKCTSEVNFDNFIADCPNVTELIFSKLAGTISYNEGQPGGSGTIYVHPDSVYLDPNSGYYGQSPISGWTVESINNYPNS